MQLPHFSPSSSPQRCPQGNRLLSREVSSTGTTPPHARTKRRATCVARTHLEREKGSPRAPVSLPELEGKALGLEPASCLLCLFGCSAFMVNPGRPRPAQCRTPRCDDLQLVGGHLVLAVWPPLEYDSCHGP